MEQDVKKKSFNKRSFISIAMVFTILILSFSGMANHKHQFEQLTVERHFWMTIHNAAAVLFVIFAILHFSYNWQVLINYSKRAKKIFISKEALAAIALVVVIIGLVALHVFHVM